MRRGIKSSIPEIQTSSIPDRLDTNANLRPSGENAGALSTAVEKTRMRGRDRTGITAALLLHILSVPDQTIVEDFVLSTKYLNEHTGAAFVPPGLTDREQARVFTEIIQLQPRYVEAVFKAIDQRYGNFDQYWRKALHLSDADVMALKSRLLE
ncbi:MAG TPA: tyrosine-protein phosphatase [Bryobacteraceae bacterium]|jgi:protein-tyrosine phosphatase